MLARFPTQVRLTTESQTSVQLSWEVPQEAEKLVTFYTIRKEVVSPTGEPDQDPLFSRR